MKRTCPVGMDRNVKVVHYSRTTCPRASIVTNNACISIPSDPRTAPFTSRLNERVKLLVNFNRKYMLIIIIAFSFLNSVASLLISRATTQKSAFYFSDSPFWFSGTMPSYCMTVLWRRRRSKVHSSLIFVLFCIAQRIFSFPRNWVPGSIIIIIIINRFV